MKLAVFSKSSLTTPISGGKFPQNPQDQQLLPGVKEAIDRLRADGWSLAIVSNQGGCDWFEVSAITLKVGQRFQIVCDDESGDSLSGDVFTVASIEVTQRNHLYEVATGSQDFAFDSLDRILVQYNTIESAIEECQYAADMCLIDQVYFCPDMAGNQCVIMEKIQRYAFGMPSSNKWSQGICNLQNYTQNLNVKNFRKPEPGMIQLALMDAENESIDEITDRIMIGNDPKDKAAALAAGFRFLDAQKWRDGALVEVAG